MATVVNGVWQAGVVAANSAPYASKLWKAKGEKDLEVVPERAE